MFRPIRGDGTPLLVLSVDRSGSQFGVSLDSSSWQLGCLLVRADLARKNGLCVCRRGFRVCEQSVYGRDSKELNTPGYVHKLCQRVRHILLKLILKSCFARCVTGPDDHVAWQLFVTSVAINRSSLVTSDSEMSLRMLSICPLELHWHAVVSNE
jgi:hypothetical protein